MTERARALLRTPSVNDQAAPMRALLGTTPPQEQAASATTAIEQLRRTTAIAAANNELARGNQQLRNMIHNTRV